METAVAPGVRFPEDDCFVGMTYENFSNVEPDLQHKHSAARVFKPYMTSLLTPPVEAMTNQGRLVVESFKPVQSGKAIPYRGVAEGAIDDWWRPELRKLAEWGQPIIIIYAPERESADEAERFGAGTRREDLGPVFGQSYRHLVNVWEDLGAPDNIRFCDCWAGWNFGLDGDSYSWLADYHPADERITYVGADPYGWCPASGHGAIEPFSEKIKPALRFCREVKQPLILPEVACYRFDGRPAWIDEMSETVEGKPRLKLLCWFERETSGCDWRLNGDPESLGAWNRLMEQPRAFAI